MFLYKPCTKL